MIARLHGRVAALEDGAVVVDTGGVGYRVHVPTPLLAELGPEGATVTLFTHLHVRDTELTLFGAADADAVDLFGVLLTVSGVGPRVALAMLSAFDAPALRRAIVDEDLTRLTSVPGIGRKTAQRIVLDLKSRLEAAGVGPEGSAPGRPEDADAVAALTGLGYSAGEARQALAALDLPSDASLEDRIMGALRALASE